MWYTQGVVEILHLKIKYGGIGMKEITVNIKLEDLGKVQELFAKVQNEIEEKDRTIARLEEQEKSSIAQLKDNGIEVNYVR